MLSILIPVYKYNITTFVKELHQQAQLLDINYEIIVVDDHSGEPWAGLNQSIEQLPSVNYIRLSKNKGRAGIRNYLASLASFDHLLFVDCDSKVVSNQYLQRYLEVLPFQGVICGGRTYQLAAPENPALVFHWKYGIRREVKSAEERRKQAYAGFQTNNFLAHKSVLDSIPFEEKIHQYGHEDTLFGIQLAKQKIPIKHIDNPLEHEGVETIDSFMDKQEKSLENLIFLIREGYPLSTRLTKFAQSLKRTGLNGLFKIAIQPLLPLFKRRLRRGKASLLEFDLYRLGRFLSAQKR